MAPQTFPTFDITDISDATLAQRLQHQLDTKTKPLGSLGRLEPLALQLGLILGTDQPHLMQPQMLVCAADHGLATRGVSAYPSDVTWQMVENFLSGGAAVSVLARQHGLALTVVDCGVRHDFAPRPGLVVRKLAHGTADASAGPAMSMVQCQQAITHGQDLVRSLPGNVVLLGEMGIGNTSVASMLLARLAGLPIADCTGAGTGLDDAAVLRKVAILGEVLALHAQATAPLDALAAFGGFEVATLVGVVLQAASERRVVLVDGFITTVAALAAVRLQPELAAWLFYAHRSAEPGHRQLLDALGAEPLLALDMRLGEGSGAAVAVPILRAAAALHSQMATFAEAGVSRA